MRNRFMSLIGMSAALAFVVAGGSAVAQETISRTAVIWQQEAGQPSGRVTVQVNNERLEFRLVDGRVEDATLAGQPIDADSIEHVGDSIIRFSRPDGTLFYDYSVDPQGSTLRANGSVFAGTPLRGLRSGGIALRGHDGRMGSLQLGPRDLARIVGGSEEDAARSVMIGVQMTVPSVALAGHFGISPEEATMLGAVYPDMPAAAGLKQFDIIVGIDGDRPAGRDRLREVLASHQPGDMLPLTVIQGGTARDVVVELDAFDPQRLRDAGQEMLFTIDVQTDDQDAKREAMVFLAPDDFPGAAAWGGLFPERSDDSRVGQMERLESRLDRMERMLTDLVDRLGGAKTTAGDVP